MTLSRIRLVGRALLWYCSSCHSTYQNKDGPTDQGKLDRGDLQRPRPVSSTCKQPDWGGGVGGGGLVLDTAASLSVSVLLCCAVLLLCCAAAVVAGNNKGGVVHWLVVGLDNHKSSAAARGFVGDRFVHPPKTTQKIQGRGFQAVDKIRWRAVWRGEGGRDPVQSASASTHLPLGDQHSSR